MMGNVEEITNGQTNKQTEFQQLRQCQRKQRQQTQS